MKRYLTHPGTFLIMCTVFVLSACDSGEVVSVDSASNAAFDESSVAQKYGREDGTVVMPFKSHFWSGDQPPDDTGSCGDLTFPFVQVVQEGSGEATHLGEFSVRLTFCLDLTDVLDGEFTEGESLPYFNSAGILTAANGDELWLEVGGEILPSEDPRYGGEFFDPFEFVGGTGRFEGASGGGMTKSYLLKGGGGVIHEWDGELILPGGN